MSQFPLVHFFKQIAIRVANKQVPGFEAYTTWKTQQLALLTSIRTLATSLQWMIATAQVWSQISPQAVIGNDTVQIEVVKGRNLTAQALWMYVGRVISALGQSTNTTIGQLTKADQYYFAIGDMLENVEHMVAQGNALAQKRVFSIPSSPHQCDGAPMVLVVGALIKR